MVEPEKYKGTNTFINKLDCRDSKELDRLELVLTSRRAFYIQTHPSVLGILHVDVDFDLYHLKKIHEYLFQDVYEWAGQIRSYPMAKSVDIFTPPDEIEFYFSKINEEIKEEFYLVGKSRDRICTKLARYFGLINKIHPFPEGNGRAQRIFLTQLAWNAGYELAWEKVDKSENKYTQQAAHRDLNYSGLENTIDKIMSPI